MDIRLWEVGAKRPLNGTSKVNRQTDTHTQTNIWTFRLIESISPEGRCFEKEEKNPVHQSLQDLLYGLLTVHSLGLSDGALSEEALC